MVGVLRQLLAALLSFTLALPTLAKPPITQTDANNHATSYAYDQRGRRVQRVLPLGQAESYTYDAAGNLKTRTDFNGKTTTYTYDAVNRLLSKIPDASFNAAAVSYTYDQFGRRQTMTDPSGMTSYGGYDNMGHATQVQRLAGILSYGYDVAGNLKYISAQNNTNYYYDALNRLTAVTTQLGNSVVTAAAYGYDNVGNLQTATYANGVVHNYSYDNRNRLRNLGVNGTVSGAPGAIASYAYTLDAAGHRTGVTELSGRTVSYGYDSIYRLTSENIVGDPNSVNGAVSYTYDPVGNRTRKVSTLPGYPGGLTNYNANDQISTDNYDANGNTAASNGVGYVYDFENRLIQAGGGISIVYDGDGNRVSKTVAGVTTTYLVDDQNPTGYAQVVFENYSGGTGAREVSHTFVYGLERTLEVRQYLTLQNFITQTIYFVYDGHGSVRALTDTTGTVTDTYDYDAFGNLLHLTGSTYNNYLYSGEQFDPDLNFYFNRARYLKVSTGRFWSMDSLDGQLHDPSSLHKYSYVSDDPTDKRDPSGHDWELIGSLSAVRIATIIAVTTVVTYAGVLLLLRGTSQPVTADQQAIVDRAISVIEAAGFSTQATLLSISSYRRTDNFINRQLLIQDQQYAATNKGFFTITLYDPFFRIPIDDVERAVALFHESYHLMIRGEHTAYAGTWSNKEQLGWTHEKYGNTAFWNDVEYETRQYAPELFP